MPASNTDLVRNATPTFQTTTNGSIGSSDTTITLQSVSGLPTGTAVTLVIDAVDANGNLTPTNREVVTGVVNTGTVSLVNCLRGLDGTTAQSHSTGANVQMLITANMWNDFQTAYLAQHTQTGAHKSVVNTGGFTNTGGLTTDTLTSSGLITASGGLTVASGQAFTATNAVLSTALGLSAAYDSSNGLKTYTNSGTAGGTGYYINLGGIKLCWVACNGVASGTGGNTYTVNLPTSFFSTIQLAISGTGVIGTTGNQSNTVNSVSTSSITIGCYAGVNGASQTPYLFVVGT